MESAMGMLSHYESFIEALRGIEHCSITRTHLKDLHMYTKNKRYTTEFAEQEGNGALLLMKIVLAL